MTESPWGLGLYPTTGTPPLVGTHHLYLCDFQHIGPPRDGLDLLPCAGILWRCIARGTNASSLAYAPSLYLFCLCRLTRARGSTQDPLMGLLSRCLPAAWS